MDTVSFLSTADVANIPKCTYLYDLDQYLRGVTLAAPSYTGGPGHGGTCPKQTYIVDTATGHAGSVPWAGFTYQNLTAPLPAGEDMLGGHTATGAFPVPTASDTDIFVLYTVQSQKNVTLSTNFKTESLLLDEHSADTTLSQTAMPQLKPLYLFSTLPNGTVFTSNVGTTYTVTLCSGASFASAWIMGGSWQGISIGGKVFQVSSVDSDDDSLTVTSALPGGSGPTCSNTVPYAAIPVQTTGPGRFMFAAPEFLSLALTSAQGWDVPGGLPPMLRTVPVVCVWGSDFDYRLSNVYLGCMAADTSTIEGASNGGTGVSKVYYLKGLTSGGVASWSLGDETQAVPILSSWTSGSPCVGEHSVRWIAPLNLFLMTYGSSKCGGLVFRTSSTPWGPWTVESELFPDDPSSGWMQKLIYSSGAVGTPNFNQQPAVYMTDVPNGATINTEGLYPPFTQTGDPYGPYQLPGSTAYANGNGTVNVFMNLSGYNPYVAWQMTADLKLVAH